MGNSAQTLAHYEKSLPILERVGDRHNKALFHFNLGGLYPEEIGNENETRTNMEKARELIEKVDDARNPLKASRTLEDLLGIFPRCVVFRVTDYRASFSAYLF
uniref:Tetratricopeptide repeat-containing protein n=2 Tax=Candidatus Kentrum sp. TC TaxID=2126339 RepID=A0A450YH45_9GAMM|nr:MAG: hypothetical protein BECKTC1821E_GA0114239_100836 [Candidatus Kentron sp. TC]